MPEHLEFIVFGLLVSVAALVMLSSFFRVPYPVLLVLGGLALSFIPSLPDIELPPDLVLLVFLPPLLYSTAFFSSPRDLKANLRPITSLTIGLVLLTSATVAVVAHIAIGLSWPMAFVLGVIVSPTDPVAVTATANLLGLPRRVVTILEGESLINDGAALTLYRTAVAAAVGTSISVFRSGLELGLSSIGGVVIGLLIGWIIFHVRRRVEDAFLETTIALFTGYAAYLPAEELRASGVLAVVAAGVYLGWKSPEMSSPRNRLQVFEVLWVLNFLLNSLLFVLIGLQLPTVLEALSREPVATLILYAALVSLAVIATRVVWVFLMTYVPRYLSRRLRERDPFPPWQEVAIVAYSGMRGAISLAAALSLPLSTTSGTHLPGRELVIFLTFSVILVTLGLQGLTLPSLISRLGLEANGGEEEEEEAQARLRAAEAALERIEKLSGEDWVREDTADLMRQIYENRRRRFALYFPEQLENDEEEDYEERSLSFQRFRRELLEAEREALLQLRNEGQISDEVRRRVERDLDLHETHLEI